jgi:hypothetical protein
MGLPQAGERGTALRKFNRAVGPSVNVAHVISG